MIDSLLSEAPFSEFITLPTPVPGVSLGLTESCILDGLGFTLRAKQVIQMESSLSPKKKVAASKEKDHPTNEKS